MQSGGGRFEEYISIKFQADYLNGLRKMERDVLKSKKMLESLGKSSANWNSFEIGLVKMKRVTEEVIKLKRHLADIENVQVNVKGGAGIKPQQNNKNVSYQNNTVPLANMQGLIRTAFQTIGVALPYKMAMDREQLEVGLRARFSKDIPKQEEERILTAIREYDFRSTAETESLYKIIDDYIRSGGNLDNESIINVLRLAEEMMKALQLSAEDVSQAMFKLPDMFGQDIKDVFNSRSIADLINFAVSNYKVEAKPLLDMLLKTGASGSKAGITESEQIALSAFLSKKGADGSKGAMIQRRIYGLLSNPELKKDELEAFNALGIKKQDLQSLKKNPVEFLNLILARIDEYKKSGAKESNIQKIGNVLLGEGEGSLEADVFNKLYRDREELIKMLNSITKENSKNALSEEFDLLTSTTAEKAKELKKAFSELSTVVGTYLLPETAVLISSLTDVVRGITDFAKENKELTKIVVGLLTILAGSKILKMLAGILKIGGAGAGVATATKAGLFSNPAGLTAVAGGTLAYKIIDTAIQAKETTNKMNSSETNKIISMMEKAELMRNKKQDTSAIDEEIRQKVVEFNRRKQAGEISENFTLKSFRHESNARTGKYHLSTRVEGGTSLPEMYADRILQNTGLNMEDAIQGKSIEVGGTMRIIVETPQGSNAQIGYTPNNQNQKYEIEAKKYQNNQQP